MRMELIWNHRGIIVVIGFLGLLLSLTLIAMALIEKLNENHCLHTDVSYSDYNTYIAKYVYKCNQCGDTIKLSLTDILEKNNKGLK